MIFYHEYIQGQLNITLVSLELLTMKIKRILLITLILFIPMSAHAHVFGGSNLGFGGYPSHDCIKPTKPHKPFSLQNQWEIDSYNSDVEYYNMQLEEYVRCIEEYIENANNDIMRIKERAQEALEDASQ